MAITIKFTCDCTPTDYITVTANPQKTQIEISGITWGEELDIIFDKKTAIKFAKTLRTEINKIQD